MILYWPSESVTAERVRSIRTSLEISTVTPGRTAPEVSLTTPAIALCARAEAGSASTSDRAADTASIQVGLMLPPSAGDHGQIQRCAGRSFTTRLVRVSATYSDPSQPTAMS